MKADQYDFVGLDVHGKTIAVAVARGEGGEAEYVGEVPNSTDGLVRLIKKVGRTDRSLRFCYEAGPCGYVVYRELVARGHDCAVVAPSLIPMRPGDRVKTDRRDAEMLARLHRAGELTTVTVLEPEREAIRDLTRLREDAKRRRHVQRQQLNALLLRSGHRYSGKTRWTRAHWRWLESLRFEHPTQHLVLQEQIEAMKWSDHRIRTIEKEIDRVARQSPWWPTIEALMALRGIAMFNAVNLVAELGDISRFESPQQLMSYLGLVPSQHSSGERTRHGGITKTGNHHLRTGLIEAAWAYRFPARKSAWIERRAERTGPDVQKIAWEAQKRLSNRYRCLILRGKPVQKVVVAVARELTGFIWAIAREIDGMHHGSRAVA